MLIRSEYWYYERMNIIMKFKSIHFKKRVHTKIKSKQTFKLNSPIERYKSMTIYKKLSVSFLALAVISSLIIGGIGVINLNSNNTMSQNIYNEDLVPLAPLYRIQTDFITIGTKVNSGDAFNSQSAINTLSTQLLKELSQYSSTVKDAKEKALLSKMTADIGDYETEISAVLGNFISGDSKAAYERINGKIAALSTDFDKLITGLFSQKIAEAKQRNEQSQRDFTVSLIIMGVVTLVSIALAATMGRLNAKLICKPINSLVKSADEISEGNLNVVIDRGNGDEVTILANAFEKMTITWSGYINEISSVLSQMSEGNLDVEISSEYEGDFVKIKDSINNIIEILNNIISAIIIAANDITTSSKQLSEGSQSLSEGAAEQAASVEELTASIAEIAKKTKENAVNASKANEIANSVKNDTTAGNGKMERMLGSMGDISESSASISNVIKVINDIAFQTNVLALNASIEAARAGSYGKGFAVVSEEVRHLALRSTEAAKDTTQMIDRSISKALEGTEIARDTSGSLKMIEEGVKSSATIIDRIAESSNEQASGINNIYKGIEEVSKIVQTNSATAEQSAAASEELFNQAENMRQFVSGFKVRKK